MPVATPTVWMAKVGRIPWWHVSRLTNGATTYASTPRPAAFSRDLLDCERKVDFAHVANDLDLLEAQSRERVRTILDAVKQKLTALLSRKFTDNAVTTSFIRDLTLRGIGPLTPTLREIVGTAFRQGQHDLAGELTRGTATHTRNTANEAKALIAAHPDWERARLIASLQTYTVKHTLEGLPPEKALEFFESKATLWGAQIRDPLLNEIKAVLYNAIKMGTPLREVLAAIEQVFLPWLGDPTHIIDNQLLEPYRLEAMIRTNIIEALNAGRVTQAQPEVDSGFIIGFLFSAILDNRTTEVCLYLDKKAFKPNSPEMERLSPPRQFNCRSLWVPLLRTEGPVTYITPEQVARGIALSGKGFCQEHPHVEPR